MRTILTATTFLLAACGTHETDPTPTKQKQAEQSEIRPDAQTVQIKWADEAAPNNSTTPDLPDIRKK